MVPGWEKRRTHRTPLLYDPKFIKISSLTLKPRLEIFDPYSSLAYPTTKFKIDTNTPQRLHAAAYTRNYFAYFPWVMSTDIVGYCDPKSTFTKWFDKVSEDDSGDSELLEEIRKTYPEEKICAQPPGIQIRVAKTDEPWYTSGNNLKVMSPGQGLQCVNSMQHHKPCANFKVRFCCLGTF